MAQGTPAPRLTAALGPNSRRHDNRTYDPGILRLHRAPHKAAQCDDACLAFSDEGARTCALTTRQTRRGQGIRGFKICQVTPRGKIRLAATSQS